MTIKKVDTAEIVRGLDPADWVQIKLLADLPPEKRIILAMRAQAFALSTFRLTLQEAYPNLSREAINMEYWNISLKFGYPRAMYSIKFYANVVRALEEIGAPYMLVGAFAG